MVEAVEIQLAERQAATEVGCSRAAEVVVVELVGMRMSFVWAGRMKAHCLLEQVFAGRLP